MTPTEFSSNALPEIKDTRLLRMYLKLFGRMKVTVVGNSEEWYAFLCPKHGIALGGLQEEKKEDNGSSNLHYKPLQCQRCVDNRLSTLDPLNG